MSFPGQTHVEEKGVALRVESPQLWAFYSAFKARKAELECCPQCSWAGRFHADDCAYSNWEKEMDTRIKEMPRVLLED